MNLMSTRDASERPLAGAARRPGDRAAGAVGGRNAGERRAARSTTRTGRRRAASELGHAGGDGPELVDGEPFCRYDRRRGVSPAVASLSCQHEPRSKSSTAPAG